jgi:hypothetical protein
MKFSERALGASLEKRLVKFDKDIKDLPGIREVQNRTAFIEQLIDSIRRVRYLTVMRGRDIFAGRADPKNHAFDPLMAAEIHNRTGNLDEACWLVFLATHCGKSSRTGWRLTQDLYGGLQKKTWTWEEVSKQPQAFCNWVDDSYEALAGGDGIKRNFGNHRKYETLKSQSDRSPAKVISSYVDWIGLGRSHQELFALAQQKTDGDPRSVFNYLYRSMQNVISFGRTGRFDYLTMLGKMGLAAIEADSAYMHGATGPVSGGKLLFKGHKEAQMGVRELDDHLVQLGEYLNVGPQAMQVMEDAICNWQKSPSAYVRFRG